VANKGGLSAISLSSPSGLALDAQGDLYVADMFNNRVLEYSNPLTAFGDTTADRVFGQADFTHGDINRGLANPGPGRLYHPTGVALDLQGNLYVADTGNNRVLEFADPLSNDELADNVIGQADYMHGSADHGGASPDKYGLNTPLEVVLDAQGNLYVA